MLYLFQKHLLNETCCRACRPQFMTFCHNISLHPSSPLTNSCLTKYPIHKFLLFRIIFSRQGNFPVNSVVLTSPLNIRSIQAFKRIRCNKMVRIPLVFLLPRVSKFHTLNRNALIRCSFWLVDRFTAFVWFFISSYILHTKIGNDVMFCNCPSSANRVCLRVCSLTPMFVTLRAVSVSAVSFQVLPNILVEPSKIKNVAKWFQVWRNRES